ncbi:Hsp70 family protein [Saccharophagus degradans]|uniref:Hsp70 family protein n=1 Tax=Saccharophagus degradans TaxID=86304 RepID=UPI001C0A175F|nr:Hsp70 family protein [Saccharophagus degradans]MBU2983988.1 Hsp70 family protein [Saccharophagus degradans]
MNKYLLLIFLLVASCSSSSAELVVESDSPIVQGKSLTENVGIETLGGVFTPLLESGCPLPCELAQVFSTAEDNQEQITIKLIRGLSRTAGEGVNLGKYKISGIAPSPRGEPQIKVVFGASNGTIWLSAKDTSGKSRLKVSKVE